jgi:hypothetical protein
MSNIFDFIHKAKTIDLSNNTEFSYELCRLFESAVFEIKGLAKKEIEYILSEVNNSIEKYRIYFSQYPYPSDINLENNIAVFRYQQLIGHIFEIRDDLLRVNLDKELLLHIYSRMSNNKYHLNQFKIKIKDENPKLIEKKPEKPQVLKQLILFSNIAFENPPQLLTNLVSSQRSKLFDLLVEVKFIQPSTDKESFEWALGSDKQPKKWQPIEWIPSKQLLRELLEAFKKNEINKAQMEELTPQLFLYKGKPMELANNKIKPTQNHKRLMKIIATI